VADDAGSVGKAVIAKSAAVKMTYYGQGVRVALEGPYEYYVPSADRGALIYGRAILRVENGGRFTLQMPGMAVTCSEGQLGVELDRSGEGWIQMFGGEATLWPHISDPAALWRHDKAAGSARKIVLGENESVRLWRYEPDGEGGSTATVIHDARLAASLAARLPPRMGPWSAAASAQPALAGEGRASAPPPSAETAAPPSQSEAGSMVTLVSTQLQSEPLNAEQRTRQTLVCRRPNFPGWDPAKCVLHVRFVAKGLIVYAIRLNGRGIPFPDRHFEGAVEQVGAVFIRDGFVGGNGADLLEFDVRSCDEEHLLPEGTVLSGHGPIVVTLEMRPRDAPPPSDAKAAGAGAGAKPAK
jgi:hypothetical protein